MPSTLEPFSGQEVFAAPPSRTYSVLSDPDALAAAMPGVVSKEKIDERTRRCTVRPSFSFLAGSIKITVSVAEAVPEQSSTVRATVQGIGLSMEVEARMNIAPHDSGSQVAWEARVLSMKGLLTAAPTGLVRAAAESVIRDGWAALRRQIESPPPA